MSDERKNYTLVQGASGSELSFTYNAENITIVQLLYQLDEAKKNKDANAFEELVSVSESVFLQDKFNQLPLEDESTKSYGDGDVLMITAESRFKEASKNTILDCD